MSRSTCASRLLVQLLHKTLQTSFPPKITVNIGNLMLDIDSAIVLQLQQLFADSHTSLPTKYRILFALRNINGDTARQALAEGLKDSSALLRHEVAYCLGQRQDAASVALLTTTLANTQEHPMVRHEAAEALGAIATDACLEPLQQHAQDGCLEVAETCQLAIQRITEARARQQQANATQHAAGDVPSQDDEVARYQSVDPAFAAPADTPVDVLQDTLLNEQLSMSERYAAMFALRNRGGHEAVAALGEAFRCRSALLKHEVAYVLGQMQDAQATQVLKQVLRESSENAMVRHEAAEALGSIASEECVSLLQQYAQDQEPIVAHSCEIALDMLAFEQAGGFDYMDISTILAQVPAIAACSS